MSPFVWVLLKNYQHDDSTVEGVYTSKELAEKKRDYWIREAVSLGESVYWNPDCPDEDNADWEVDWEIDGPHRIEEN